MTHVVYLDGVGFLSLEAVTAPQQVVLDDGRGSVRVGLRDTLTIGALGDAARFPDRASSSELAERLNAREHHKRWRALSWDTAAELVRGAA